MSVLSVSEYETEHTVFRTRVDFCSFKVSYCVFSGEISFQIAFALMPSLPTSWA